VDPTDIVELLRASKERDRNASHEHVDDYAVSPTSLQVAYTSTLHLVRTFLTNVHVSGNHIGQVSPFVSPKKAKGGFE
jgi:hypothetical protein